MKIVIDIPEWKYKSICEGVEASKRCGVVGIDSVIHEAIYNGTPLPKGHGRLIDADAFITTMEDTSKRASIIPLLALNSSSVHSSINNFISYPHFL